jgi:hypothetical protein
MSDIGPRSHSIILFTIESMMNAVALSFFSHLNVSKLDQYCAWLIAHRLSFLITVTVIVSALVSKWS